MSVEIVGREELLEQLHAFIGAERGGGLTALVLEGEAGIGKSTLWRAAIDDARARDLRVLTSRPAEAERELAHVGLGDLFDGVLDDVLPLLSAPRRRALEVALLRVAAPTRADPRRHSRRRRTLFDGTARLRPDQGKGVTNDPAQLLASGALVWIGNNFAFALLYWLVDSGGPVARARKLFPIDFAFTQQMSPELAPPGWRPVFLDYLHLGFTNATALALRTSRRSPTSQRHHDRAVDGRPRTLRPDRRPGGQPFN